jgi:hypothetical protein
LVDSMSSIVNASLGWFEVDANTGQFTSFFFLLCEKYSLEA